MTTKNVITGSEVTLTIDSVVFTPQVTNVTLTSEAEREVYETLSGPFYKTLVREYELDITGLADWGATDSVCDALQAAFDNDPDTSITFVMTAVNDPNTVTVTGKVFPQVPAAGGAGAETTEFDVSLTGDVNETLSISNAVTPT
jgi:hypothetical protein